jgi:hypothetical protein
MLVPLAIAIGALLVGAAVYDLVSRARHRYRSAAEWSAMSRLRKSHLRRRGAFDDHRR